jgi:hypothetical protein
MSQTIRMRNSPLWKEAEVSARWRYGPVWNYATDYPTLFLELAIPSSLIFALYLTWAKRPGAKTTSDPEQSIEVHKAQEHVEILESDNGERSYTGGDEDEKQNMAAIGRLLRLPFKSAAINQEGESGGET